jgi:Secretion system C-terminal sorting domain
MKIKLLLLLSFTTMLSFCQNANRIRFTYDDAGNQTDRFICLCQARGAKETEYKNLETLEKTDFIQEDKISFYPNPVREELYVNWKNKENNAVGLIELYNMNGQLLKTYKDLKNYETATIEFQIFTEGFYNLVVNFENGEKQTLKIVKK